MKIFMNQSIQNCKSAFSCSLVSCFLALNAGLDLTDETTRAQKTLSGYNVKATYNLTSPAATIGTLTSANASLSSLSLGGLILSVAPVQTIVSDANGNAAITLSSTALVTPFTSDANAGEGTGICTVTMPANPVVGQVCILANVGTNTIPATWNTRPLYYNTTTAAFVSGVATGTMSQWDYITKGACLIYICTTGGSADKATWVGVLTVQW